MKSLLRIGLFLTLLSFLTIGPAFSQALEDTETPYQQWVDYKDGEISFAFDEAPVGFALNAIHAQTGLKIVLPAAAEAKLVNLRLNRLPLEPAVRSLISSIGFRNFALMYDETGRPSSAVVVEAQDDRANVAVNLSVAPESKQTTTQPLTVEEREKLQKELQRWNELKTEERGRIEDRLKNLPASEERDQLVKEYGRQLLELKK
jgi:hypothetical protein